jgi:cytochrome c biogenesis protein CcdA
MLYTIITAGLLDSYNPCAFGVLLLFIGLLFTMTQSRALVLYFGSFYIAAIYFTYFIVGLGILKTFHLFGIHNFVGWVAATLLLIIGLFELKQYFFPTLYVPILSPIFGRCHAPRFNKKVTVVSALISGFFIGLCAFPCAGAIYLATISMLSIKATFWSGVGYLAIYNLMFVLPIIIVLLIAVNKKVLKKIGDWHSNNMRYFGLVMGGLMTLIAVILFIWLIRLVLMK